MDPRIIALTPFQRRIYELLWTCGVSERDNMASIELDCMKDERPADYEAAFAVWQQICLEVMN